MNLHKKLRKVIKKAARDLRKISLMVFPAVAAGVVVAIKDGNNSVAWGFGAVAVLWYLIFQVVAFFLDYWSSG